MALRTHTLTATEGGNPFPKAYSDRLVIVPNAFGFNSGIKNPAGSYSRWEFQVDNSASTSSECQPGLVYDQTAYVRWKVQNYTEYRARVKAFSAVVLGTMFGRFESSGVGCGSIGTAPQAENARRANVSPLNPNYSNNSPVFDMEAVRALAGLPEFVGNLPDITIDYDIRTSGGGQQNKFLDMYLHDVSDQFRIVGGFPGPGYGSTDPFTSQPLATTQNQLLNTINGINYNLTKDWNINVWLGVPDIPNDVPAGRDSDNNWAGGELIGRYNIGGIDHDFYYKLETAGANNFDYIGLVMINPPDAGNIRVKDYMDFATNTLPGIIQNNATANAMYGTQATRGKAPPRFPDANHVLGGLHLGSELFYSNADGSEGVVEFRKALFNVPNLGTFGWSATTGTTPSNSNPDVNLNVTVGSTVTLTPSQVGNVSDFVDTPVVDINHATVEDLSPAMVIRGNGAGSTVIEYVQADGTTGKINLTVAASTDGTDNNNGNPTSNGQSTNYRNSVPLFGELAIKWVEIHTSGEEIAQIKSETASDKVKVSELSPNIVVDGLALGTSIIEYVTVGGNTGTFTIDVVSSEVTPEPEEEGPYIGTRYVNPGETINLNMNLMPTLASDTNRVIADEVGPGSALVVSDELEITMPVNATGTGTVEID